MTPNEPEKMKPQYRITNNAVLRYHNARQHLHIKGTPLYGGEPTRVEILFLAGALMIVNLLE